MGRSGTVDFRIQVGGDSPTVIPYVRTGLVSVSRANEEATARAALTRTESPVRCR